MANKKITLCDTDVLIEFYRGNTSIVSELKTIGQANIAVSATTWGELIYGAFNKNELRQLLKDLSHLKRLDFNEPISQLFLQLMEQYSLSHNLTLPDAIIAATAMHHQIPLYTLNTKDFIFLPKLVLYRPAT